MWFLKDSSASSAPLSATLRQIFASSLQALYQLSASPLPFLWQHSASSPPAHLETKQKIFFCKLSPSSLWALRQLSSSSPPALLHLSASSTVSPPSLCKLSARPLPSASSLPAHLETKQKIFFCKLSPSSLWALGQLPAISPPSLRHLSAISLPSLCHLYANSLLSLHHFMATLCQLFASSSPALWKTSMSSPTALAQLGTKLICKLSGTSQIILYMNMLKLIKIELNTSNIYQN